MEKEMDNEMEALFIQGVIGIRVSQKLGYLFGGANIKDCNISGSTFRAAT